MSSSIGGRQFDIVVVGSANYDYTIVTGSLPRPGETVAGIDMIVDLGGKGANQAVAARRLGASVAFTGRVGRADGDRLADGLMAEGVDTRHLVRDETRTGMAMIVVDASGQKQIICWSGANGQVSPADVVRAAPIIASATLLLVQLEIPMESVRAAIETAHREGTMVMVDPAPASHIPDDLMPKIDVIRPNAHEAGTLTGIEVTDRESARRAAQLLIDRGARAASVQAGDEGDLIVWRDGELFLPRFPVTCVDATAAGDAFAAALAVKLAAGRPLSEAGPFASAAAALATTRAGAQSSLPTADDVAALLASYRP